MSAAPVGIDAIGVYAPPFVLPLDRLAAARGVPVEKIHQGLGAREMAVAPPWEDAVTLAANAAARPIAAGVLHPEEIGLLLVATETAVDHAKPIGIFLHELLGLGPSCRTVELKHACYGGTAGLMLAASWLQSGAARGRKALVVATDIARYDLESSAEFTQGAGAAALVVAAAPRLLELHPATGVYARNVYDFWRPLDRREALVDGKFSVACYLDALDGALADHRAAGGATAAPLVETLAALLYHAPFPKMAHKAHARLVAHEWARAGRPVDQLAAVTERTYADLVESSLGAARLLGNTYTASLYLSLAWLAEREATRLTGRDVGFFSYGSGCCAEFFTGRFAADSAAVAAHIGLADLLGARRTLGVDEYEAFRSLGAGAGAEAAGGGAFRYAGEHDHKRRYERQARAA
jgi:hydroxymethylglutaryl-CoA synthase